MGRTIVITGSTRGLGLGLARELLARGENVVISIVLRPWSRILEMRSTLATGILARACFSENRMVSLDRVEK